MVSALLHHVQVELSSLDELESGVQLPVNDDDLHSKTNSEQTAIPATALGAAVSLDQMDSTAAELLSSIALDEHRTADEPNPLPSIPPEEQLPIHETGDKCDSSADAVTGSSSLAVNGIQGDNSELSRAVNRQQGDDHVHSGSSSRAEHSESSPVDDGSVSESPTVHSSVVPSSSQHCADAAGVSPAVQSHDNSPLTTAAAAAVSRGPTDPREQLQQRASSSSRGGRRRRNRSQKNNSNTTPSSGPTANRRTLTYFLLIHSGARHRVN